MRTILLASVLVVAAATPALAGTLPQLDVGTLPAQCRWTGDAQAKGQPAPQQLAGITSAANCMAIVKLRDLRITPTQEGASAVNSAIQPSLTLLDSVISSNDLESSLIAAQAKADLLQGAAVKIASAARPVGRMTGNDLATFTSRVEEANVLAAPFREQSALAFQQLANMARSDGAHQLAAHNQVVASVISDQRMAPSQISRR